MSQSKVPLFGDGGQKQARPASAAHFPHFEYWLHIWKDVEALVKEMC